VRVVPATEKDRAGLVGHYLVLPDGAPVASGTTVPTQDVIQHVYKPDYLDEYQAAVPLLAALRWIRIDNVQAQFLEAFYENSGQPAGFLKFKRQVDPEERQRVRELWRETYGLRRDGTAGWGDVGVLDSDVDYQETGSRPGSKLAIDSITDQTESRICMALGCPPIMIACRFAFAYQLSYASYAEARLSFWHETMMPMANAMAETLTAGLCSAQEFGEDLVIEADYAGVAALAEDIEARRSWAIQAWTTGLYTRDEALVRAGEPSVGGDRGGEYRMSGLAELPGELEGLGRRTLALTPREIQIARRVAEQTLRDVMRAHWRKQSVALRAELEDELAAAGR
jgi:HK97 family phage portal protein